MEFDEVGAQPPAVPHARAGAARQEAAPVPQGAVSGPAPEAAVPVAGPDGAAAQHVSGGGAGTVTDPAGPDPVPEAQDGTLFAAPPQPVRLPSALSPSRAGDFVQCPLLFRLRVIDKVPEPPSPAATRGTLVHAVLERLFDLPAGQRTPEEAAALLEPQWERLAAKTPEVTQLFDTPQELAAWLASAKSLIGRYFTLEDPNRLEPAEREMFVRAVIGRDEDKFILRGVVDRLDVAPGNLLRVVDYKTGKAPPAGYEAKVLFQLKLYALALWRIRGVVPKRLQLIFLGSGDVLTYDPQAADLEAAERKIAGIWAAIRSAVERGHWPAQPTKLCNWCHFITLCPAHNGTPPPLPAVEVLPAP
jgi:putative RecB family exonuclease